MAQSQHSYSVEKWTKSGEFVGEVSGIGRNKGTWDSRANSKRTAQRWAAQCRKDDPHHNYKVYEEY